MIHHGYVSQRLNWREKKLQFRKKHTLHADFNWKYTDFVDISIVTVLKGRHDFYVMIKKNKQKLFYTDDCKLCSSGATILFKMRPQIIKYELTCVPRKNTIDKGGGAKQNFVWNKHTRYRSTDAVADEYLNILSNKCTSIVTVSNVFANNDAIRFYTV